MICIRCKHPLKTPSITGYGPVCAKKAKAVPVPTHERDLLGYNIEAAVASARYVVKVSIDSAAAEATMAVRRDFAAARRRLLGWA